MPLIIILTMNSWCVCVFLKKNVLAFDLIYWCVWASINKLHICEFYYVRSESNSSLCT